MVRKEIKWYHRLYNLFAYPIYGLMFIIELCFFPVFYVILGSDWDVILSDFNNRIVFTQEEPKHIY